jgi:hypothetical protein
MKRPSAALVVASAALCFSIAGTGIAANHYLITSTKQIKPSVLAKLRGATGPRGIQGKTGTFSTANLVTVTSPDYVIAGQGYGGKVSADCPAGKSIVSGGYFSTLTGGSIYVDQPDGPTRWTVEARQLSVGPGTIRAYAICG